MNSLKEAPTFLREVCLKRGQNLLFRRNLLLISNFLVIYI